LKATLTLLIADHATGLTERKRGNLNLIEPKKICIQFERKF